MKRIAAALLIIVLVLPSAVQARGATVPIPTPMPVSTAPASNAASASFHYTDYAAQGAVQAAAVAAGVDALVEPVQSVNIVFEDAGGNTVVATFSDSTKYQSVVDAMAKYGYSVVRSSPGLYTEGSK